MPLPLVPIALGAAALAGGYYFLVKKPGDVAGGAAAGTPRGATQINPSTGTASALPTGFPAELAGKFQTLLSSGQDPDAMDQVADRCEALGYQTQALQLRMRAAELRRQMAAGRPPASAPPPVPAYSPPAASTYTPTYAPPPPAFVPGVFEGSRTAVVTTNDPPPSGDLVIRSAPSGTAPQIGGAEKNGTVTLLDTSDPTWAKISWSGGSRWPAITGYARKAYLRENGAVVGRTRGYGTAFGQADLVGKRSGHRQADLIGRLGPRFNRNY